MTRGDATYILNEAQIMGVKASMGERIDMRLNRKAYPVAFDKPGSCAVFWRVWSPWHRPHLIGRFKAEATAGRRADTINRDHGIA